MKDISIAITKCHNSSRIVELIHEEKCDTPEGEPTAPGSLVVDQHETDEHGNHVLKDGNEVSLTSADEGKLMCDMCLEEAKIKHQEELQKCTDDKSRFEDNKRKTFDLTLNKHCTKSMKNGIKELVDFDSMIRNDPLEASKRIKTN